MTTTPRVSVVVPVYNGERCVANAIDSILAQDFAGLEVIAVDDGSVDGTPQVLRGYGDRIRVLRQDNQGGPAACNAGVAASRAELIAFLDADDVWLSERLAKTVAALDGKPDAVLAYTDTMLVDGSDKFLGSLVPADKAHAPSLEELIETPWWPILPSTLLIRRWAYEKCGGLSHRFLGHRGFVEVFLFLTLREQCPFFYVP
jgi:glycosyltransferase involved in cell wall biosynthesis